MNVNLSQRLVMTPSLLQKIELLTLDQLELNDLIGRELVENPFLEEIPEGADYPGDNPDEEASLNEKKDGEAKAAGKEELDFEYYFGSDFGTPFVRRQNFDQGEDRPSLELFVAAKQSLSDHLEWQLSLTDFPETLSDIVEFIVGNLDEKGYLLIGAAEIADELKRPETEVAEALEVVQNLDPAGVGARNLQECISLQLEFLSLRDSLSWRIVREFLPQVEKKRYREITKKLNCSMAELKDALDVLKKLSPYPGEKYSAEKPAYIRPDIFIYKMDGEYLVFMNDDGMPQLTLNREYRRVILNSGQVTSETKSYVREKCRSALELLRSIEQRQQTIFRVCMSITRRQREFLEKGWLYLKPLLIKEIAEELDVHPSTISRTVSNKYAHTPQGVIELRRFFTVGIDSSDGTSISAVSIKEKIRKIIDTENPEKPYSDQSLTEMLATGGIKITRRTVAKYRDQLRILGSRDRRQRFD
ncbi:MAG: RNA polymerase factor sigma-54 [Acidobacteriota bacterium]